MLVTVALLLLAHFIADFLLQPHWMAIRKSQELKILAAHVSVHAAVFFVFALVMFGFRTADAAVVAGVVTGTHAVIDWNIWRGYKRYATKKAAAELGAGNTAEYKFWEDHWFYVVIGADQLLHGLSILLALYVKGLL